MVEQSLLGTEVEYSWADWPMEPPKPLFVRYKQHETALQLGCSRSGAREHGKAYSPISFRNWFTALKDQVASCVSGETSWKSF